MMGTGTERERERGWRQTKERKMGTGTGVGTEMRAVVEMGTGTGVETGSGRAEEKRRSARNCTKIVDAIMHFHSARVTISADRGWCLRAPDSSVRKARCLYTRIIPRG